MRLSRRIVRSGQADLRCNPRSRRDLCSVVGQGKDPKLAIAATRLLCTRTAELSNPEEVAAKEGPTLWTHLPTGLVHLAMQPPFRNHGRSDGGDRNNPLHTPHHAPLPPGVPRWIAYKRNTLAKTGARR